MRLNKTDNQVLAFICGRVCNTHEELTKLKLDNNPWGEKLDASLDKLIKCKLVIRVSIAYQRDQLDLYFPTGTSFTFGDE